MKETIRVKILKDGVRAKEVNSIEKPEPILWDFAKARTDATAFNMCKEWQEAESKLRTFEIENSELTFIDGHYVKNSRDGWTELCKGDTYTAELLENGKIKIID